MPICIECRYPVPQLYHVSSNSKPAAAAPDAGGSVPSALEPARGGGEAKRSTGGGGDVRLTQCPRCRRFADKYVEHDFVVLFIDLVLVKPQVYRHLLFNRLGNDQDRIDPSILRLGTLLLLFDVYLTWSATDALPPASTAASPIPALPVLAQYAFYLLCCGAATLAQHLTVRTLARLPATYRSLAHRPPATPPAPHAGHGSFNASSASHSHANLAAAAAAAGSYFGGGAVPVAAGATTPSGSHAGHGGFSASSASQSHAKLAASASGSYFGGGAATPAAHAWPPPPQPPGPNAISTAVLVSSCMQLFPIIIAVWKYDDTGGQLARGVSWAVGAQNVEALRILLGCGYGAAGALVGAGAVARWLTKTFVLRLVGLGALGE